MDDGHNEHSKTPRPDGSHDDVRRLPASLYAPVEVVNGWRMKALISAAIFGILSVFFLIFDLNHFLRAWLAGYMFVFGLTVGGLALLMVQYLTGGKWGVVLRRPLEAMSRTLPLLALLFLPVGFGMKRLYIWAAVGANPEQAYANHAIDFAQLHAITFKRPMLNPEGFWIRAVIYFLIWAFFAWKLNAWSLRRDADPEPHVPFWQKKFENISGIGVVLYAITLTVAAIDWVMSIDPTWFSTMWGFLYIVNQGFAVLAFSILIVLSLSYWEPMKTMLRITEQHDLGKLTFAFVMLNIYLAFSQYLIIWSGNSPDEIGWYLDRFRGGWATIITLDFVFHWVIPFTLLLSRNIKRDKRRLMAVCRWILFARIFDLFWQIEPGFPDSRRNLHFSVGILAYIAVPLFVGSVWLAYFFTQLKTRPVFVTNDPHVAEILEPEHVHA
jgi:hypothetical protein